MAKEQTARSVPGVRVEEKGKIQLGAFRPRPGVAALRGKILPCPRSVGPGEGAVEEIFYIQDP